MDTARSPSPLDYERDVKRQKPSANWIVTSSTRPSGNLCIIYFSMSEKQSSINIAIVDPRPSLPSNVHEFALIRPVLQLADSFFYSHAFCVLNSVLYAFEGHIRADNPNATSVRKIDLPSIGDLTRSSEILGKNDLVEACDMRRPKILPVATPTPDGKILVFSSLSDFRKSIHEVDFELYDPKNDTWEDIPRFEISREACTCKTLGYTFVDESTFLIVTNSGVFTLNLASLTEGWTQVDDAYAGLERLPYDLSNDSHFFLIEKHLCLTSLGAYVIQEPNGKLSDIIDFPHYRCLPLITLLDVHRGKYDFCVVQAIDDACNGPPCLILDVCSFDLDELEKTGELKIRSNSSLQFLLDEQRCESLHGFNLYTL